MNTNGKQIKCPKCGCEEYKIWQKKSEGATLATCSKKRCGHMFIVESTEAYEELHRQLDDMNAKCPKCDSTEYLISPWKIDGSIWGFCPNPKCKKNQVFMITSTPEYEDYLQSYAQSKAERNAPKSKPIIKCSYCGSDNIKKISGTRRFFSTGILGLASNTIGKNFHCRNCGSDF